MLYPVDVIVCKLKGLLIKKQIFVCLAKTPKNINPFSVR